MNKSKIVMYVVLTPIALALFYGGKHIAHVKCVEGALDMLCKKSYQDYQRVESVDVPWWNPNFISDVEYGCSAKIAFSDGVKDVGFTAKKARIADITADDWDVNLGFWGWLGNDYRIMNVKAK